ncbi:MAG: NADH dehydrogenase [Clostridiales bacterium]|nr:NADH dehydrogenase [Clostridiales bacterium]
MQGNPLLLVTVLLPFAAAPLAYGAGRRGWKASVAVLTLVCALSLAMLALLFAGALRDAGVASAGAGETAVLSLSAGFSLDGVCGFTLALRADGFRALYALLAAFLWLMTSIFSFDYFRHEDNVPRYACFTLMTLGAALGVLLSDTLWTTFLFFEVLSLASYPWVAQSETRPALRAAETYLYIAVIGGLSMLMGLFLLPGNLPNAPLDALPALAGEASGAALWLPCALLLVGFGAKAGAFPLHVWLPKAHPVAPAPASALLSGMLTKTGVFGVLVLTAKLMLHRADWGALLFWVGVVTMLTGALLALLSNDLKRVLASSSLSQIGMILMGAGLCALLGEENGTAVWATVGHMVNHSVLKLLLFLCAGTVTMNAHAVDLDSARGFGRNKPLLHIAFLSGLLGISGAPLFNGYASKSLLHEALLEQLDLLHYRGLATGPFEVAEGLFLLAGGLTLAYMLKLYVCLFWQLNPTRQAEYDKKRSYLSPAGRSALLVCALLPLLIGLLPDVFISGAGRLSQAFLNSVNLRPVRYFSAVNLMGTTKSFVIGVAVYGALVRPLLSRRTANGFHEYPDRKPAWLDLEDSVYRPLLSALVFAGGVISRALERSTDALITLLRRAVLHRRAERPSVPGGNRFVYAVGALMDTFVRALNYTLWRKRPVQPNFVYALAAGNEEMSRQSRRLTRSVSFSLLMFCLGLFLVLAYLLVFS